MIILLSLFRRVIERFVFGYHINEACTVLDCFIIDLVEISQDLPPSQTWPEEVPARDLGAGKLWWFSCANRLRRAGEFQLFIGSFNYMCSFSFQLPLPRPVSFQLVYKQMLDCDLQIPSPNFSLPQPHVNGWVCEASQNSLLLTSLILQIPFQTCTPQLLL